MRFLPWFPWRRVWSICVSHILSRRCSGRLRWHWWRSPHPVTLVKSSRKNGSLVSVRYIPLTALHPLSVCLPVSPGPLLKSDPNRAEECPTVYYCPMGTSRGHKIWTQASCGERHHRFSYYFGLDLAAHWYGPEIDLEVIWIQTCSFPLATADWDQFDFNGDSVCQPQLGWRAGRTPSLHTDGGRCLTKDARGGF